MTHANRNEPAQTDAGSALPEMPWTAAWRYAKQRAFSPKQRGYWALTIVVITVFEMMATDLTLLQAIGGALLFTLGIEAVEFFRRFVSGPPVGQAGREEW